VADRSHAKVRQVIKCKLRTKEWVEVKGSESKLALSKNVDLQRNTGVSEGKEHQKRAV